MDKESQPVRKQGSFGYFFTYALWTFGFDSRNATTGKLIVVAISSAHAASDARSGHRAVLLLGNSKYDGFTLQGVGKSFDSVEKALNTQGFLVQRRNVRTLCRLSCVRAARPSNHSQLVHDLAESRRLVSRAFRYGRSEPRRPRPTGPLSELLV